MKLIYIAIARIFAASMLLALAGQSVAQQAYATKFIRIIVPYSAGGGTDILTRLIARKLTDSWSRPAVVDNRPGGNTIWH